MTLSQVASVVSIVKDGLTGIGAVVLPWVAWRGLETWKRQLHGEANYEVAKRLLKSTYRLREAIAGVRSPAIFASEIAAARKAAGMPETGELNTSIVYECRWQRVVEARIEFDADMLEAEAVFGKDIRELWFNLSNMLQAGMPGRSACVDPSNACATRTLSE